jgi:acyl carrier protein
MENEKIGKTVFGAIRSFNEELPAERRLAPSLEYQLVGSPNLDSADLVNLLVMIEQRVEQELGTSISLFDDEGIERFTTVQALVNFLAGKLARDQAQGQP